MKKEKFKDSEGCLVLSKAIGLRNDIEEEEQAGSDSHEDFHSPVIKKKRVYSKNKYESATVVHSVRLKSKYSKQ